MQWSRGEKALAHFELVYARLPRFETREDARLLFVIDKLLKDGASARRLMLSQGLDTSDFDLLKYNADELRVPAGNGRESGRWTSGAAGANPGISADSAPVPHIRSSVSSSETSGSSGKKPEASQSSATDSRSSSEVISDVPPDPVRPGQQYAQGRRWPGQFLQVPIAGGNEGGGGPIPSEEPIGEGPGFAQAPSSRALARALEKAGEVRPPDSAAHHIVAGSAPDAVAARLTLQKFGIGINDAENGIFLPTQRHVRLHTSEYYFAVNSEVATAASKEDVIRALRAIKRRLQAGEFP